MLRKENYYLKMIVAANKISPLKDNNKEMASFSKQTSQISPQIGVGIGTGYHFNDNLRMDLTFESYIFNFNDSVNDLNVPLSNGYFTGAKITKRKATGNSLMLNGYVNLLNRNTYQIFAGAGIGASRLKEKVSHLVSGTLIDDGHIDAYPASVENYCSKTSLNLSYSIFAGISAKANEQINLEFMYKWQNYGKIRYAAASPIRDNTYKGGSISVTLRVDL